MIEVDSLLYGIDQRLNKLSSFDHENIALEDKLLALNEAQIKLIKEKVGQNNIYKIGLDGFKKRYQDLQFLIENPEDHPLIPVLSDKYLNRWTTLLADVSPQFMFYVDAYLLADKGECKNRIIVCNPDLVKHADIQLLLKNDNFKPSFDYQETIIDIASDELHIYTDGEFIPTVLYLTYIRYPKEIDKIGYVHFDGTNSIDQNCELEAYLKDELLDLATECLAQYTENNSAAQYAKQRQAEQE